MTLYSKPCVTVSQSSPNSNSVRKFIACNSFQFGDVPPNPFSFLNEKVWIEPEEQMHCHLTYTNEKAHKIIAENMHLNRHVREEINGPRYNACVKKTIYRARLKSGP